MISVLTFERLCLFFYLTDAAEHEDESEEHHGELWEASIVPLDLEDQLVNQAGQASIVSGFLD